MPIEPDPPLDDKVRWLNRECWDFALALDEQIDGTLIGLHTQDGLVVHVGLQLFEDWYLDARGLLTGDEIAEGFGDQPLRPAPVSLETIKLHAGLAGQEPPWESDEMDDAREAVEQLLAGLPEAALDAAETRQPVPTRKQGPR